MSYTLVGHWNYKEVTPERASPLLLLEAVLTEVGKCSHTILAYIKSRGSTRNS